MKRPLKYLLLAIGAVCGWSLAQAQAPAELARVVVVNGDTMLSYQLAPVSVEAEVKGKAKRQARRADRLTRHVQKVYPYAQMTGKLLDQYNADLERIEKESDRELYIKLAEAELRAEFEYEIKGLTMSQGRILTKLIDRQTGTTSYELVRELKGNFNAWVWQGVAKLFGQDLKSEYDPAGDDQLVESIVRRIENGELAVIPCKPRTERATARLEKRKARLSRKYGVELPDISLN